MCNAVHDRDLSLTTIFIEDFCGVVSSSVVSGQLLFLVNTIVFYIEHLVFSVFSLEMLQSQPIWKDFDTEKNTKLLSSMAELSKKIEEQVNKISCKLQGAGFKPAATVSQSKSDKLNM